MKTIYTILFVCFRSENDSFLDFFFFVVVASHGCINILNRVFISRVCFVTSLRRAACPSVVLFLWNAIFQTQTNTGKLAFRPCITFVEMLC